MSTGLDVYNVAIPAQTRRYSNFIGMPEGPYVGQDLQGPVGPTVISIFILVEQSNKINNLKKDFQPHYH